MPWSKGGTICTNERSRRANREREKKKKKSELPVQFIFHSVDF